MSNAPTVVGQVLVVGIGSPDRGDDAWGPQVAGQVAALGLTGVDVLVHEDPTDLVQDWHAADLAVVVDAVAADVAPGTLLVRELGTDQDGLPPSSFADTASRGTHAFGLAAAVELSRALGRLPRRVVLVGVQAGTLEHGAPMTPAVALAMEPAVTRVRALVERTARGGGR